MHTYGVKTVRSDFDIQKRAREQKTKAMILRDEEDFDGAIKILNTEISALRHELTNVSPGLSELEIAKQLSNLLGSSGGVYRRAKNYAASVRAYDEGYEIESDPRYNIVNSYNLTQRLVARVFLDPEAFSESGVNVRGVSLPEALKHAYNVVSGQIKRIRELDEYAHADKMIISALAGRCDWKDDVEDFVSFEGAQQYAFEVTLQVVEELHEHLQEIGQSDFSLTERIVFVAEELDHVLST